MKRARETKRLHTQQRDTTVASAGRKLYNICVRLLNKTPSTGEFWRKIFFATEHFSAFSFLVLVWECFKDVCFQSAVGTRWHSIHVQTSAVSISPWPKMKRMVEHNPNVRGSARHCVASVFKPLPLRGRFARLGRKSKLEACFVYPPKLASTTAPPHRT